MTLPHNSPLLTKSREDISNEDSSVKCIMLRTCVCFSGDNLSLSTVAPGKNILSLACLKHPSFLSIARIYCQYLPLLWKGFSCAVSSSPLLSPYMDWKHTLHWAALPVPWCQQWSTLLSWVKGPFYSFTESFWVFTRLTLHCKSSETWIKFSWLIE